MIGGRGAGRRRTRPAPTPAERSARRRRRLRLAAIALVVGVVVLELGLRIVLGNFAQSRILRRSELPGVCLENEPGVDIEYTGWFLRTAPTRMRINALGGRGEEVPPHKQAGVLRVVALGDSFTFGQGVQEDEAFVQVAGRVLAAAGIDVEVLNFGVPGHGTPQSVALLREKLVALEPDLVLLGVFANDLSAEDSYCLKGQGGNVATRFTLRSVYTGRLLYMLGGPLRQPARATDVERLGSPADRYRAAVRELGQLGEARGFLAAVVLLTDREMFLQSSYCDDCTPPHDLMSDIDVHTVDMSRVWLALQQDIPKNFIRGDDHLSVEGNARMGRALGEALAGWDALRARAAGR